MKNKEMDSSEMPRLLMLNSKNSAQRGASGYGQLTTQFPDADVISVQRRDPSGIISRLTTRIARVGAVSTWYRPSSLKLELQALSRMRSNRYEIVHVLWGDSDLGHLTRLRPPATKLVVTLHNVRAYLSENFPNPSLLRSVDGFVLMAPDQAEFLEKAGIPPERFRFIPHGIHADVFLPKEPKSNERNRPLRVVHVGSYLRDFPTLAETTRLLADEAIVFDILASQEIRKEQKFSSRVHWHHEISQEKLVSLYQNADILLMTATAATANNALLEGLSCGLPVVTQNIPGLTSYLNEDCAMVAMDSSAASLAAVIRRLAADPGCLRKMGDAARQQALTLEWRHVAERTREFYYDILG